MRIATIIGARPQIIKSAALSRAINSSYQSDIQEILIHTGQHFDGNMSEVFFSELQIPKPDYNLNCHAGTASASIENMKKQLILVLEKEMPDAIVVFGDTNSTLAGSLVAEKMRIPLVHIEAGLRSFNRDMPEEKNRYECDHRSTLLFIPTDSGIQNLYNEGFTNNTPPYSEQNPALIRCGDIMYDNSCLFSELSKQKMGLFSTYNINKENFILATIHRNFNTDIPERLHSIFSALIDLSDQSQIILPLHPRTGQAINNSFSKEFVAEIHKKLSIIPPLSFLEMTCLENYARLVVTDSGGVQKEAFFFQKPSVVLRAETEWTEIVECGAARLSDASYQQILSDCYYFLKEPPQYYPPLFGDGHTAEFICKTLLSALK